ncbi:MAG TPA: dihydrolipoyl dehydrogenase [Candidatus Brocadiia bacterium]|nr:dihydrolipoyl dehydrogenase [Candidatus Brocadiia bacterium]
MDYDLAVIGAGPGGYVAAIKAAQLGAKVAVIESRELGGTCLNRGCIPTKALLESSGLLTRIREAQAFGITVSEAKADYPKVVERAGSVVGTLRKGVEGLLKKNGVTAIQGRARFLTPNVLEIEDGKGKAKLSASKVCVASGSKPAAIKPLPFDGQTVISSDEAIWLRELPQSILIIGGGYIGCEFACLFAEFGVKVTVVEMLERIVPNLDPDMSRELSAVFKRKKIAVLTGVRAESCEAGKGGAKVKLSNGETIEADKVLVCPGRAPNSADMGLEVAGVKTNERGFIATDADLRTNVADVYAIGDVNGRFLLAHVASRQGVFLAEKLFGGHAAAIRYDAVPACCFTHPEIATVGMTEDEAKSAGRKVAVSKFNSRFLGKSLAMGETVGMVKIIADAQTGQILGVHIIGAEANAMIAEAALAVQLQATAKELAATIHTHPTLPEGIMEAAEGIFAKPIHA